MLENLEPEELVKIRIEKKVENKKEILRESGKEMREWERDRRDTKRDEIKI